MAPESSGTDVQKTKPFHHSNLSPKISRAIIFPFFKKELWKAMYHIFFKNKEVSAAIWLGLITKIAFQVEG